MARARNIKPSLFKNEILGEADPLLTILFEGLWCLADREGRVEDRPKRIKAEIFPYRDLPNFNGYLTELAQLGFIDRYEVGGEAFIQVVNFTKHQSPHKTEKPSEIPAKPENPGVPEIPEKAPLNNGCATDEESLIPDSLNLIPDCLEEEPPAPAKAAPRKQEKFTKPNLDQLEREFVGKVRDPDGEAYKFFHHFESNGWKVGGKSPMKSWESAVAMWATRSNGDAQSNGLSPQGRASGNRTDAKQAALDAVFGPSGGGPIEVRAERLD